jgi:hypothetical protein
MVSSENTARNQATFLTKVLLLLSSIIIAPAYEIIKLFWNAKIL